MENIGFASADYDAPEDAGKRPQLKVIVDSEPPEIDFEAQRNAAGQVEITWACADATLDPNTIQLQYRLRPSIAVGAHLAGETRGIGESDRIAGHYQMVAARRAAM